MKAKLIPVCSLIIVSVLLFGCSSPESPGLEFMQDATVERTCEMFQQEPHHGGDVVLGVDGTLTVILCSNQTTGFQWSESPEISGPTILQQLDHEFVTPEDENIVGGAGKEIFTFKTLKKGISTIHFEYSRPWEGGEKGEWTYDLEVHVREPSPGQPPDLEVKDATEARDAALTYIREYEPENALSTDIVWQEQDVTPPDWVGGVFKEFTSDEWTIKVTYAVLPLEDTVYQVMVSSIKLGWHWKGNVAVDGGVTELSPFRQMSEEESEKVAEEFLKNSPTFAYDGIEDTLVLIDTITARCPYCWLFVFEFDCSSAGYGDRTGQATAQVITQHEAAITVEQLEITSAVMDEQWDMIKQEMIGEGDGEPEGALSVAELLENPVYNTEITIWGEVGLLGELLCPCFELTSGGATVQVWYDLMVENDGTERPSVSVEGVANGDRVIVTGELKGEGGIHYNKGDFRASVIIVVSR